MHYCIHLLTKQLPTEKEIEKIMEPYSWDSIDDEDTDDDKKKIEYPVFTWDWYQIGGKYSARLLVDGARQKDILNLDELGCFGCVLPDGSAIARESWTGDGFVEDDKFEEKYKKAVADNMDGFLTVLDVHD